MPRFTENVTDGFFSLEGGMNAGISPSLIQNNQYAFGCNVTTRGGFARTRPKYLNVPIDFQGNIDAENWFLNNPISGEGYFQTSGGQALNVCCAGGRFFAFQIGASSAVAFEFTPPGSRNSQYQQQTWFCQAANLMIAQNGLDIPVIFDGSMGRRSNILAGEIPVGRQMAYINSRIFVVATDMRQILPGDLAYATPTSVVTFLEINNPASEGGQPLSIPLEIGGITGMVVTAQTNTIAGQGQLLVTTDRAVCSINPIVQRNLWPTIQLQSIALIGNGYSSSNFAVVNADVWGRSVDGFRSYIMAERNFITYGGTSTWGNTPQSQEVSNLINTDDQSLLKYAGLAYFDNRLLMTVCPQPIANGNGCYHEGIISLNFDNISSINKKTPPAYEGVWTGITPYGFCLGNFSGVERCFMFSYRKETGQNELWEITRQYGDDNDDTRISCFLESRSFNFQTPFNSKDLQSTEIFADEMSGQVDFVLQYKPDQYPCWLDYNDWSECAGVASCSPMGLIDGICAQPVFTAPQFRPRMDSGRPPLSCDPAQNRVNARGYEYQLRIQWTGQAQVRNAIVFANVRDENAKLV